MKIKLWLDDYRKAPDGWLWVKTVRDAQLQLLTGQVEECSLDHDLGACADCMQGMTPEEWFYRVGHQESMPHCDHVGTGYDLVKWMAEHSVWPKLPVMVHSMNPVGAARMLGTISRYQPSYDPSRTLSA